MYNNVKFFSRDTVGIRYTLDSNFVTDWFQNVPQC